MAQNHFDIDPKPPRTLTVRLYRLSGILALYFVLILIFVQLQRFDQPLATPISHDLAGPFSNWLRSACYLLGVSFAMFGVAVRRTFCNSNSHLVMLLLFISTWCIAMTTWFHAPWPFPEHPVNLFDARLHLSSAITTFICAFSAMIVLTAVIWRVQSFCRRRYVFLALDVAVFIMLLLNPLLYSIHGALEKLVTLQMIAWQMLMIRHLSRLTQLPEAARARA